ncbi:hypothetical protein DL546_007433 [Coniochaeta pulveracea]|uniref:Uncharacterized protein n=1 Tax=Coniochaeta pulveracea TaxID=177199 RepID=A0A420YCF2_9PEZI|nr:hypothetical protein DL546_007433 [Coniochaeta pulveracea]
MKLAILFFAIAAAIQCAIAGNVTCFSEGPSFDVNHGRQGAELVINKLCGRRGFFTRWFKKDMLRKGCEGWSQLMDSNPPIPGEPPYFADLAVHLEVKNTSPEHGLWFASRACRDQFWYIVRMCPRGGFLRYIPPYGEAPGTGLDLLIWHKVGKCARGTEEHYLSKHDHHRSKTILCKPPFFDQQLCHHA